MSIIVCGINHKTAPISIRERLAIGEKNLPQALSELLQTGLAHEAVILSTCNRTEIYCVAESKESLKTWFDPFQSYVEIYEAAQAAEHIMRVASGLDSMILGEPQILGQMKRAYAIAEQTSSMGKHLSRLFQTAFKAAKMVRSKTSIGEHPVSVAYAAIKMAQRIFKDLAEQQVICIGSGEMIELSARYLNELQVKKLIFANRTLENSKNLAEKYNGLPIGLGSLPDYLPKADIIISATASELPIIGKGRIESAMKMRKYKPMILIDLAVPRDMEAQISEIDNVYLYDIDGLGAVVKANQQAREKAATQANVLIQTFVNEYMSWCESQHAVDAIKAYRHHHEKLRDAALAKANKLLEAGKPTPDVLAGLAHHLTNQLLHLPTLQLKQANQPHLLVNKKSEEHS